LSFDAVAFAAQVPVENPGERAVLLYLADLAAPDGTSAWPTLAVMAEDCGITATPSQPDPKDIVRRHLRSLLNRGVIRHGDSAAVSHLPPGARPAVWDLVLPGGRAQEDAAPPELG